MERHKAAKAGLQPIRQDPIGPPRGIDKETGFRAAQALHSGRTLTAIFAPQTRQKHPPKTPVISRQVGQPSQK